MLLRIQKYNLDVKYEEGKKMFADTLNHAYLPAVDVCDFAHSLEEVDHTVSLSLSTERLQQIKHASQDASALQRLRDTIQYGWPQSKSGLRVFTSLL